MYNLNISTKYVPDWGGWEIAREIICNAIDADPNYEIKVVTKDKIEVITKTFPELKHVLILGEGTKSANGDTIGQFGEGMKLASLACIRDSGNIIIHMKDQIVSFYTSDILGSDVLHANIEEASYYFDGCRIELEYPDIADITKDRIIKDSVGPVSKTSINVRIYSKGVFITELQDTNSFFDWNLSCSPNRDRNMIDTYLMYREIGRYLTRCPEELLCFVEKYKLDIESRLEFSALEYIYSDELHYFAALIKDKYGDKCCVSGSNKAITYNAEALGYTIIPADNNSIRTLFKRAHIPVADDLVHEEMKFEISSESSQPIIDLVAPIHELTGWPKPTNISLFTNEEPLGYAARICNKMWINEKLLYSDSSTLIATYLHELCHLMYGYGDITQEFEYALTQMLGVLGEKLVKQ